MIRSQLHISRDMPFTKVVRSPEEDAKGVKPVTVTFEKSTVSTRTKMLLLMMFMMLQDRNNVLQKAKMLKGSNILISEDYPKDVMEKRKHLIKFAKAVRI